MTSPGGPCCGEKNNYCCDTKKVSVNRGTQQRSCCIDSQEGQEDQGSQSLLLDLFDPKKKIIKAVILHTCLFLSTV